ncbi:hypothetical protein NA57DRAFT_47194 [Rhizodiscina lignyota]|uniref:Histone deacetylase complex subunit SAP30 Sin3 binding domain-containing protein n=1 Tax=Rhizodiscina lignyota TaxID=1504668 RepID=A0A9P4I6G8_9PEZI|nr:hypothetical protein NA57DRAFT_47194 [Rhizodiscina lignyota]
MPPARRALQEDSKSEESTREKLKSLPYGAGRGKRASNIANGTNLREIATSNSLAAATNGALEPPDGIMNWNNESLDLLHRYRHTYRLSSPSAFSNPISPIILSPHIGLGIGKYSPTMARAKSKRRITKEQLALAVRKNFNAMAVDEAEVLADLYYSVGHQDKTFRVKFAPPKKNPADSGGGGPVVDTSKGPLNRLDYLKSQQAR